MNLESYLLLGLVLFCMGLFAVLSRHVPTAKSLLER